MNVDDVVQERIAQARIKIQAAKRRREELAAARQHGLRARHAQKLRRMTAKENPTTSPAAASNPAPDGLLERGTVPTHTAPTSPQNHERPA